MVNSLWESVKMFSCIVDYSKEIAGFIWRGSIWKADNKFFFYK